MFDLSRVVNDSQAQARLAGFAEILADLVLNAQGATGHVSANGYHESVDGDISEAVERFVAAYSVESFGEWVGDFVEQEDAA